MKKILVCVMVLALCLCATISSFAAGTTAPEYTGETKNNDVNITINGEMVHVYLVDIVFNAPTSRILPALSGIPRTMSTSRILRLRGTEKARLKSSTTPICLLLTR